MGEGASEAELTPLVEPQESKRCHPSPLASHAQPGSAEFSPLAPVDGERESCPESVAEAPEFEERNGVPLSGPFRQSIWTWILAVVTFVFLSGTVLLAWKSADLERYLNRVPFKDTTMPLRVLRILTEINTLLLTGLVAMSSRAAVWAASSTVRGISVPMWLAMSPSTSPLGLLKLLFWRCGKSRTKSPQWHWIWILGRYFLLSILGLTKNPDTHFNSHYISCIDK